MKKEVLNPAPTETNDRSQLIRSMVLNFKSRTLTCADHEMISEWLHEAEPHQQLFEKWLMEKPAANDKAGFNSMAIARHPGNPLVSRKQKLVWFVVFLMLVVSLFIWLF